jgi:hypothetical protein
MGPLSVPLSWFSHPIRPQGSNVPFVLNQENQYPVRNCRAGHFRYFYRSSDIRYLSDTEKSIEISNFKSIGRSNIGPPNFDFG